MKYLQALLAVLVFTAAVSIAIPRVAPVAARVGLVAIIILAALWLYDIIASRPPPLTSRVLEFIRGRGPVSAWDIARDLNVDYSKVAEALEYLVRRGIVRRIKRGDEEYYDIS